MKRRALLAGAAAVACTTALPGPGNPSPGPGRDPAGRAAALLGAMPLADRVAQTMSVAFRGPRITAHLERMIAERHVGGVILFAENVADAAGLRSITTDLQAIARRAGIPPLLISIDHEGGPVIRVGAGLAILPAQMALAATPDPAASVRRAVRIAAHELRALGVNLQLAPVADVNDEPRNPIIGSRAFGSDPRRVGELTAISVRAYAEAGLLCCVKHFPGHGSATVDSHDALPSIDVPRARLDAVELAPFRAAITAGAPAVMSAHLSVPALGAADVPATLSPAVMTTLLRDELGFRGLAITDDLEMGALVRAGGTVGAARAALAAGSDYLLFRFDADAQLAGHRRLIEAVESGELPAARVDSAATRVLAAKARWSVLEPGEPTSFDLAADQAEALDLARLGITLLRAGGLPLRGRILAVSFGRPDIAVLPGEPSLAEVLGRMVPGVTALRAARLDASFAAQVTAAARDADVVVVGTFNALGDPRQRDLVNALQAQRPTVAVALRTPYDLIAYPGVAGYLCAYSGREPSLVATVEVLTGARRPAGRLPVELPGHYGIGAGMAGL